MGRIWFVSSHKSPCTSQLCHSINWLIDWLIDWVLDWSIDWLIDWLSARLSDWLIDWLIFPVKFVALAGAWLFDWAHLSQSFWRTFIEVQYISVYRDGNTWEPETNVMHLEIVHEFLAARRTTQMGSRDYAVSAYSHSRKDRRYSPSRPLSPRYSYIREDRVIRKDKSRRRHSIKETVTLIIRSREFESVDWLALWLIDCSNDLLPSVSIDWFFKRLIDWLIDRSIEWVSDQSIDWLIDGVFACFLSPRWTNSPNFFLFFSSSLWSPAQKRISCMHLMVIVIKLCASPSDSLPGHFGQADQAVESVSLSSGDSYKPFCPWFFSQIKTRSPMSTWKASKFRKRPRTFSPVRPWRMSSRNMTTLRKECQVCEMPPTRLSVGIIYSAFATFTYLVHSFLHLTSHFVAFVTDDAITAILPHEDIKLFKLIMGCKFSAVSLAWLLDWMEYFSLVSLAWLLDWMEYVSLDSLAGLLDWMEYFSVVSLAWLLDWMELFSVVSIAWLLDWMELFSVVSLA